MSLDIPDQVRNTVISDGNESWLDELPGVVDSLAREWSLMIGSSFAGGHAALVVEATLVDGTPAVLKIGVPGRDVGPEAGSVMRVHKAGDHADRPVYRCQEPGKGHVSVPVAPMDDLVRRVVVEMLSRPDAAGLVAGPVVGGVDVAALRADLVTCRERLDEIAADCEDDRITRSQFLTRTDKRRAKMAAIEAQLAEATDVSPLAPLIGADDVAAAWGGLTMGQQRAVIKALITVTVQPMRSRWSSVSGGMLSTTFVT